MSNIQRIELKKMFSKEKRLTKKPAPVKLKENWVLYLRIFIERTFLRKHLPSQTKRCTCFHPLQTYIIYADRNAGLQISVFIALLRVTSLSRPSLRDISAIISPLRRNHQFCDTPQINTTVLFETVTKQTDLSFSPLKSVSSTSTRTTVVTRRKKIVAEIYNTL